ncbi:MAG TPA: glycosyltransferase family 4 protein, partial [Tepidisphaeraceae bacterium]|nr:glycosyltransferase family 4 protein [Tepidisphaeraceae bacterium]
HDFLYTYAGAERVLEQMVALFPQADLYSLFDFLPDSERGFIAHKRANTSFIQKLPWARKNHRPYLPLMPIAIEQFDLSGYDIVLSSSYLVAKGVIIRPDQFHICYCHTPARFAWDLQYQYLNQKGLVRGFKSMIARIILHYLRNWDVRSSNSVDVFLSNSDFVGRRIHKIYRRTAQTIHPPVDTDSFALMTEKEDYYLTTSRMVQYKRIDLIVQAFNQMPNRRLIVIGEGPELEKIRALAGKNVRILGFQSAERLRHYMQRARAFVFAAEEDFGIAPVEAQCCGTPVIAFGHGGVVESIVPGQTGLLFTEQSADAIKQAVEKFEEMEWDPTLIRKSAERFSVHQFRLELMKVIKTEWAAFLAERLMTPIAQSAPASPVWMPDGKVLEHPHEPLPVAKTAIVNVDPELQGT